MPEITAGDDIGALVCEGFALADGDVVAISQKIVSKAEGRLRRLDEVTPTDRATALAESLDRDPRLVELVLQESESVLRAERGVLITRTRHGFVCANAGIDASNVPGGDAAVALLPVDPDASARAIRARISSCSGRRVAVLVTDSFGRAWRLGQSEVAIGCAGLRPLDDWRGREDGFGRPLAATVIATADQAAAAADLARDKTSRTPVVVIRGLAGHVTAEDGPGAAAVPRPEAEDLFP